MGMNAVPVDATVFKIAVPPIRRKLGSTPRRSRKKWSLVPCPRQIGVRQGLPGVPAKTSSADFL